MPIDRRHPIGEVSPQPLPNIAPNVPAASEIALFGRGQIDVGYAVLKCCRLD